MKFRDDFMNITFIDPLSQAITIASACNLVFRRNFLREDTIGIVPDKGYRKEERQSIKAIKYLKWYSEEQDLDVKEQYIQHAHNEGEFRVGPYKVDGLLRSIQGQDLKKVFSYHGCVFHG
jgi:hypothetical protein